MSSGPAVYRVPAARGRRRRSGEGEEEGFDTPTLVECWRTASYWHDGSAAPMDDLPATKKRGDKHGRTSRLSAREIEELAEYVLRL